MLLNQINEVIKNAMRSKQAVRRDTLRAIVSDIKLAEKEVKRPLDEAEELQIVNRHAKQIKESIAAYTAGNRLDLVVLEEEKLSYVVEFLPKQLTKEEVIEIATQTILDKGLDTSNKGILMKNLMPLFKGKADGKMVNDVISKLSK